MSQTKNYEAICYFIFSVFYINIFDLNFFLQVSCETGKTTAYGCAIYLQGHQAESVTRTEIQSSCGAQGGTKSARGRGLLICTKVLYELVVALVIEFKL